MDLADFSQRGFSIKENGPAELSVIPAKAGIQFFGQPMGLSVSAQTLKAFVGAQARRAFARVTRKESAARKAATSRHAGESRP